MDKDINNRYGRYTVYASDFIALDSNVEDGGGTDNTEALQSILNKAVEWGSLHLIMDGAALVSGLKVFSNTTIECINKKCGFFLKSWSNCPVITNAHHVFSGDIEDENITLIGGTYNQNCREQLKGDYKFNWYLKNDPLAVNDVEDYVCIVTMYGVRELTIQGVTLRNQRNYGLFVINWYNARLYDINIEMHDDMGGNQDGMHFCGPGQFLDIHNVKGSSSDDFIGIGSDELTPNVCITDVLIDGLFLEDAAQGVRMLSRSDGGRLDRITVRNISGTYKSFGFFIQPWVNVPSGGNFGSIIFENINLNQTKSVYNYTTPFLFRIGGNMELIVLKDIFHHCPGDKRSLIDIGWPHGDVAFDPKGPRPEVIKAEKKYRIDSLIIDGLHILEKDDSACDTDFIRVEANIGHFIIRNSDVIRCHKESKGCLIRTENSPNIENLIINDLAINKMDSIVKHCCGKIGNVVLNSVTANDMGSTLLKVDGGNMNSINSNAVVSNVPLKE